MPTLIQRCSRLATLSALATLAWLPGLVACSGGGSSTVVVASTGSVVVLVTDAPSDEFLQIPLTVTKVELLGAQGHVTLFEGRRELDLLSLRDDARLLALGREVPAGDWSKIRLHVDDVQLIRLVPDDAVEGEVVECPGEVDPDPGFVCEAITPKLGGNGKLDLNPRGAITVGAGEVVFIQLDLDAIKSIWIHQSGNGRFMFRPVVFIDAFTQRAPDRLVRLEGTIREIDLAAQKVLLCRTHVVFRAGDEVARQDEDDRSRCIDVRIGPDTSIFGDDGQPALLSDLAVGDRLAALGRFRVGAGEDLVFDALWIQQGGFDASIAVTGEILEGVASGDDPLEFLLAPDPDGPIQAEELVVRLLEGAKIFARAGQPLFPSELEPGQRVRAFGVLVLSGGEPDRLDTSLVFVRAPDVAPVRLRGVVSVPFDSASGELVINARSDVSVAPRCVALEPSDAVFRIVDTGDLLQSERIEPTQLAAGEIVDVYGVDTEPCFDAQTLISIGFSE